MNIGYIKIKIGFNNYLFVYNKLMNFKIYFFKYLFYLRN